MNFTAMQSIAMALAGVLTLSPPQLVTSTDSTTVSAEATREGPPLPETPDQAPAETAADRCQREGRDVCRAETIGGAVLTGTAIAAMGVGFGLVFIPDKPIEGRPAYERQYEPVGATLITLGIIVLTAGIFLFVDAKQKKRGPRPERSRR